METRVNKDGQHEWNGHGFGKTRFSDYSKGELMGEWIRIADYLRDEIGDEAMEAVYTLTDLERELTMREGGLNEAGKHFTNQGD